MYASGVTYLTIRAEDETTQLDTESLTVCGHFGVAYPSKVQKVIYDKLRILGIF